MNICEINYHTRIIMRTFILAAIISSIALVSCRNNKEIIITGEIAGNFTGKLGTLTLLTAYVTGGLLIQSCRILREVYHYPEG